MNDKELLRVANRVRDALLHLRESRYLECTRQLNLFAFRLQDVSHDSKKLGLAITRGWLAASEQCCQSIDRHLGEIPYAISKLQSLLDRRQKEVPTLSAVLEELKALDAEFDDVAFNGDEHALCVVTEPITLEDVYLGRFRILLDLDKLGEFYQKVPYYIVAIDPHPAAHDEAITHPHVSNEVLCEGDGAAAIRAALEEGRLSDFFSMVRSILTNYNPDSPYVPLADWDGLACYDCGYVMDSESSYSCSYCGNAVCDNCSRVCTNCGEIVCGECFSHCEICDRTLCPDCKQDKENEDEEQQSETTDENTDTTTPQTTALG